MAEKYDFLEKYSRLTKAVTLFALLLVFGSILTVFCVGVFLPLFGLASVFAMSFNLGIVLSFFTPLFIAIVHQRLLMILSKEIALSNIVGKERILWFDTKHFVYGKSLWEPCVQLGWNMSEPFLKPLLEALQVPDHITQSMAVRSYEQAASLSYIYFIESLHSLLSNDFTHIFVVYYSVKQAIRLFKNIVDRFLFVFLQFMLFYSILISVPAPQFARGVVTLLRVLDTLFSSEFWTWFKWRVTAFVVQITVLAVTTEFVGMKYTSHSIPGGPSHRPRFGVLFRDLTMKLAKVISAMGLPSYIRSSTTFKYDLQETLDLMRELGWPVNVEITEPDYTHVPFNYREWVLCGSSFQQGILNLKTYVDRDLDFLRVKHLEWKRTEQYGSYKNEFESTSRYFHSPRYDFPDLSLDDVWFVVKDIFQTSQLTPFNYIIKMWEKRYALGAFMTNGKRKKMKRSTFINSIGYQNFKNLWRKTFEYASLLTPTSAVRIKDEALPYSKWAADKVRTVIGSPITQYIMSTIFNYEPNHRFKYNETPIKIGMPLNGYNMAKLYIAHSRCQHHVAGDMTAFDSTLSGDILKLIKAVRKKGFENHRDVQKIAHLIDVNYEQVEHQLLNLTSTGNVFKKGSGLTTGHSSTSMDNSLALLILYLMAWKELTGLSSKEFLYFNQLSNFGDDHVLSYLSTKPPAWNFKNIQRVMKKWGITNRKEAEGPIHTIPFLSKYCRKPTFAEKQRFEKMGMEVPLYVVYHDKERLLGKMLAPVRSLNPLYRAKRLLSYMELTAHHYDVYRGIKQTLSRSIHMKMEMDMAGLKIPSYDTILRRWYNPNESFKNFGLDFYDQVMDPANPEVYSYGELTIIDQILGVVALLPDLVNPVIFNHGYVKAFQSALSKYLQWPFQLLAVQNSIVTSGEMHSLVKKTNYSVLEPTIYRGAPPETNMSTLLVRHWLYCWYKTHVSHPGFGRILNSVSSRIGSFQYLINAKVPTFVDSFSFRLVDIFVMMVLNIVYVPFWLDWVSWVNVPRPDLILGLISHYLQVILWSNLPPNFNDLNRDIRRLKNLSVLVEAPTGTGKSTVFIKHLSDMAIQFNKIFVVEPRVLLAKGLSEYVSQEFGLHTGFWANGTRSDSSARVEYITPQEALMHMHDLSQPNVLIAFDEVHLNESFYTLLFDVVKSKKIPFIGMTGTPTEQNMSDFDIHKPLTIANLWSLTIKQVVCTATDINSVRSEYESFILRTIEASHPLSTFLVFYPWAKKTNFDRRIRRSVSKLYSGNHDTTGKVILSTSVADVGLTIPDVDVVITPDFDFFNVLEGNDLKVGLKKLDKATLRQRAGRTGRTNNGLAFQFVSPSLDLGGIPGPSQRKKVAFLESLEFGLNTNMILQLFPTEAKEFVEDVLPNIKDYDLTPTYLDELKKQMDEVRKLRAIRETLEDEDKDFMDSWVHLEAGGAGTFTSSSNIPTTSLFRQAFTAAKIAVAAKFGEGYSEDEIAEMSRQVNDHIDLIKNATRFNEFQGMFNEITITVT